MTVYGKSGKRHYRSPPFPQTLEIDEADFHIFTAATTRMIIFLQSPAHAPQIV
jgi:hypothetical protein